MDTGTIALIVGLAILGWLLVSFTTISKIIEIRRTPTTWISALSSGGRAEVVGKTIPKTIQSPINKKPCVLWQIEIQEEHRQKKGTSWSTVLKKSSSEAFEIEDETGKIVIRPEGADLILNNDSYADRLDSQTMALLSGMGVSTTSWLGTSKNLRYHERLLTPQEEVYVIGDIIQDNGCKSIAGSSGTPLVISDRSEQELLKTLFWRVATNFAIACVIVVGLIFGTGGQK